MDRFPQGMGPTTCSHWGGADHISGDRCALGERTAAQYALAAYRAHCGQDGGEEEGPLDGVKVQVRHAQITRRLRGAYHPPPERQVARVHCRQTAQHRQRAVVYAYLSDAAGAMPSVMAQLCPASQPIEAEAGL